MKAKKKTAKKSNGYVEYSANNSGGSWWLSDKNWKDLEKAGWEVRWCKDDKDSVLGADKNGRWLGALAQNAIKRNVATLREAVDDWERVTKKSSTDAGCPCCGQPHNFTLYDDSGKYIESGPHASYEASW